MPSEKVLLAKKETVAALTEQIKGACSCVLFDYKGITVEEDTKLRKELREAGVKYSVEKNSMLAFALKNAGYEGLTEVLSGTTAVALSENDQTAPARILGKFAKGNEDKFILKAGFVEGDIYDTKGVNALSKVPAKEVLLSQLLGALQGPITGLACIVKAVAEKKEQETA